MLRAIDGVHFDDMRDMQGKGYTERKYPREENPGNNMSELETTTTTKLGR